MMKVGLFCVGLCFAAVALRAQAQDPPVVFLPPSDFDKDAPPVDPDEGKPTEPADEDKTFDQDNGKHDPTTAPPPVVTNIPPSPPNLGGPGRPGNIEPTASEETPVVPPENCAGVRCSLDVVSTCPHPVLLPGRCCPSCPNKNVCSGVRCGCGKVCSEHAGRAICCKKSVNNAHARRLQLHNRLDTVNEFGENCSLRHSSHGYVRACNRGNCTRNETCIPTSKHYATCCKRKDGSKPVCHVTHPKILASCTLPTNETQNCTCRVKIVLGRRWGYPYGYGYPYRYGHHRHRRAFHSHRYGGYYRDHRRYRPSEGQCATFVKFVYSPGRWKVLSCYGPVDACQPKLGGHRRSRRGLALLGHWLANHTRRLRKRPHRYSRMCRYVRV